MSTLTIRLDEATEQALAILTRDGRSRSEAVRAALQLAQRQERSARLRAEAEASSKSEADLAEIRAIRAEMDAISAW